MSALERWQDATSQNITSAQTTGYRKRTVQFSTDVAGKWNIRPDAKNAGPENEHAVLFTHVTTGINFMTGETQPTRRELDVAIQGDGFFEMDGPGGQKLYTRSGEFRMTPERVLVGAGGLPVLTDSGNQITMLPGGGSVTINRDGTIFQGSTALGKLAVEKFTNPSALIPTAGGMFVAGPNAGKETVDEPELMQGYLEQSNVQPLREMVDLVLISRAYEANQKIITTADQQMEKTLQALG
ncbi:MAG: flagellar hook basal-body protein [Opitutae bacterium]|nr:flagellar hook basal-body protein [Opitutae bacterium]